jgi:trimethylamine:corrinoid methyltransferase-like protein
VERDLERLAGDEDAYVRVRRVQRGLTLELSRGTVVFEEHAVAYGTVGEAVVDRRRQAGREDLCELRRLARVHDHLPVEHRTHSEPVDREQREVDLREPLRHLRKLGDE